MENVVKDLPEVVYLKKRDTGEVKIALKLAEAIRRELQEFAEKQPIEFFNLARQMRLRYFQAARRSLRRYFPGAESDAIDALFAVLRAALIHDGLATRLGIPYDVSASFAHTGTMFDRHLYNTARKIADQIVETSYSFGEGNDEDWPWLADRRKLNTPNPTADLAQGLILVIERKLPNCLITPWGTWEFAYATQRADYDNLVHGGVYFKDVATKGIKMTLTSERLHTNFYAVTEFDGEALPQARAVRPVDEQEKSRVRYIKAVWQSGGEWLDPDVYF